MQVEGEQIPDVEIACPLVVARAFQELRTMCLWVVGRGQSVVGHGDIVAQVVDIDRVEGQQWFRGETLEGCDRNL